MCVCEHVCVCAGVIGTVVSGNARLGGYAHELMCMTYVPRLLVCAGHAAGVHWWWVVLSVARPGVCCDGYDGDDSRGLLAGAAAVWMCGPRLQDTLAQLCMNVTCPAVCVGFSQYIRRSCSTLCARLGTTGVHAQPG